MTNETKNKLEILVVEDRAENIAAAKTALEGKANLDIAKNYEDGLKKIEEGVYHFGIFDLELPRREGMNTERLGFELENAAEKYALDYALITTGTDHRKSDAAFVRYCFDEKRNRANNFEEITGLPKSDPRAWNEVYNSLVRGHKYIQDVFDAKQWYFKTTGKTALNPFYKEEK